MKILALAVASALCFSMAVPEGPNVKAENALAVAERASREAENLQHKLDVAVKVNSQPEVIRSLQVQAEMADTKADGLWSEYQRIGE